MKKNILGLPTHTQTGVRFARILGAACVIALLAPTLVRADTYVFSQFAGNAAVLDQLDGAGSSARFLNPTGVAVDSAGTLYVADGGDHTIRRITAGGIVTTVAGASGQAGSANGAGSGARFIYPFAIAVDATGNLYVTDIGDHTVRKITASGVVTTLAGSAGVAGSLDGAGTAAQFSFPQGIAVDATGNVYVSDTGNSTIRKISASGVVTTFAGAAAQTGTADGNGGAARFNYPWGLAVDAVGNIYVADQGNSTVRKITSGGTVSTYAGSAGTAGSADGAGAVARFDHPSAVSLDAAGNVYVMDTSNQTVRRISISTGSVTTLAGSAGIGGKVDGAGAAARFFYPFGIAVTGTGTVYVADTGNHSIRTVSAAGATTTFAGSIGLSGIADGSGAAARFAYPAGLAVDGAGAVYVADHNNHTVRKVTASGAVTTLAGAGGIAGSADGPGGAARFNGLAGVAVDGSGNVYVADTGNSTIRKITANGSVSTFAGLAGVAGNSDGAGSAARFNAPQGIAVDTTGNVYVADTNNSTIRKISATGTVTTIAGAAGQTGSIDGFAGGARFNGPYAVAVDNAGDVYVADFFNATIRKVTAGGSVTTVAGFAGQTGAADGVGATARFNQTYALAVDPSGNLLVADTYNRSIRKIFAGGVVTTVVGPQSRFFYPQGIAVDAAGNVYVADGDNQSISKGLFVAPPPNGTILVDQSAAVGGAATFSVGATDAQTTYQWQLSTDGGATWTPVSNNATYSGATTGTLTITNISAAMSGAKYRAQLSNLAGASVSGMGTLTVTGTPPPPPPSGAARLINLSVRTQVGSGGDAVFVGFAINGTGSKQMLVRGIGPTLATFNVTGALTAPQLALYNSASTMFAFNAAWGGSATMSARFAAVGAFPLPASSSDTALYQPLTAGTYSAQISGTNNTTGIALAELYDADTGTPTARLANVSARAQVGSGAGVLVAGFVITGTGTETLLIRGIGPSLAQFNLTGVLPSPRLTLFNSSGAQIDVNARWGGSATLASAFTQVGAFALDPGSGDTALLVTLPAGLYSAQISSSDGISGLGLIEVYEIR